jgi:hypothetical protein
MHLQSGLDIDTALEWSMVALAVLVYPGLLFGAAIAMTGEWALTAVRPLLTRRIFRLPPHPRNLFQPVYDFLKLAGRQSARNYIFTMLPYSGADVVGVVRPVNRWPALLCAVAPILVLALLPFPGNPIAPEAGSTGDLFVVLALLTVQPVCRALLRLNAEDISDSARGAQDIGRLTTGLFPALVAVAALVEVAGGNHSLLVANLTAAPETAAQATVRLLSGPALLLTLPWWLDFKDVGTAESAGSYAGRLLQRVALAALWTILVLPAPGDLPWALAVAIGGTFFAYVAMRIIIERISPTLRETNAARLVWVVALPLAAISLVAAFLSGA